MEPHSGLEAFAVATAEGTFDQALDFVVQTFVSPMSCAGALSRALSETRDARNRDAPAENNKALFALAPSGVAILSGRGSHL